MPLINKIKTENKIESKLILYTVARPNQNIQIETDDTDVYVDNDKEIEIWAYKDTNHRVDIILKDKSRTGTLEEIIKVISANDCHEVESSTCDGLVWLSAFSGELEEV